MTLHIFEKQKDLALDAYKGFSLNVNEEGKAYSKEELNFMVKQAIIQACGGEEWNTYKFKKNRYEVFEIIANILPPAIQTSLGGKFDPFANFKDTALGDLNSFTVTDNKLFKVLTIARGMEAERQTLTHSNYSVATDMFEIVIYTELDLFMSGRIDWSEMVDRVAMSFADKVGNLIYTAIKDSYSTLDTANKQSGAFDATKLLTLIRNVKLTSGTNKVAIFGDQFALRNIADIAGYSDASKDRFNDFGYYGTFAGTDLIELPQAFATGTTTPVVSSTQLLVIPTGGEKIVDVVFEGTPYVDMKDSNQRADRQMEYIFNRAIGVGAKTVPAGLYGIYSLV